MINTLFCRFAIAARRPSRIMRLISMVHVIKRYGAFFYGYQSISAVLIAASLALIAVKLLTLLP